MRLCRWKTCRLVMSIFAICVVFVWWNVDPRQTDTILSYSEKIRSVFWTTSDNSKDQNRFVTMRRNLTFLNASTNLVRPDMNITEAEKIFHRSVRELEVVCPYSRRFGNKADGGWDVCLYGSYRLQYPCLIYSFGINNDWSFDDAVVWNYNCTVRAFDPSMKIGDHIRKKHIWFTKKGIGGKDSTDKRGWTLKTLSSFVAMLNDSQTMIDYLKIDVEYAEWRSLDAILNSTILTQVKQFGFEIHTNELNSKPSSLADYVLYSDILHRLTMAGFYRWYIHLNPWGTFKSKQSGLSFRCCYEMVFLNVNIPLST